MDFIARHTSEDFVRKLSFIHSCIFYPHDNAIFIFCKRRDDIQKNLNFF